jgi:two-component system, NtrC family, response regulator GlrR
MDFAIIIKTKLKERATLQRSEMYQRRSEETALCSHLVGQSPAFLKARAELLLVARYDVNVLIEGETGTGKEVFARFLHNESPRRGGPFVAINCAAIPAELAESELFGHRRGAFTHAHEDRGGLVAEADKGTLFLDEISSMETRLQGKLLRFIQEREYRRVGGDRSLASNVRIIAASGESLKSEAQGGRFRWDLFYRLAVFPVRIPPLRERREDIMVLLQYFLARYADRFGLPVPQVTPRAANVLLTHDWPGNVREIENVVQWLVIHCAGRCIEEQDLPPGLHRGLPKAVNEGELRSFHQKKASLVASFERSYLQDFLAESRGNVSQAARAAGKNRRALVALLKKHEIDPRSFRAHRG